MESTLTIATTPDAARVLVTMHLPMNNGQQILLSMIQPKGPDSIQRVQAELIRQARMVLEQVEPPDTP